MSKLRAALERITAETLATVEAYDLAEAWEARDAMVDLLERCRDLMARRYGVVVD